MYLFLGFTSKLEKYFLYFLLNKRSLLREKATQDTTLQERKEKKGIVGGCINFTLLASI